MKENRLGQRAPLKKQVLGPTAGTQSLEGHAFEPGEAPLPDQGGPGRGDDLVHPNIAAAYLHAGQTKQAVMQHTVETVGVRKASLAHGLGQGYLAPGYIFFLFRFRIYGAHALAGPAFDAFFQLVSDLLQKQGGFLVSHFKKFTRVSNLEISFPD